MALVSLLATACANGTINDVACPGSTDFRRPISPEHAVGARAFRSAQAPVMGSYADALKKALVPEPRLRRREAVPGDEDRRQVAVLSGGGQYGAYGAGFIKAWRENAGKGIEFTVVTGISTGALQSTPVFLGEPADSADLVDAYSIDDEEELAKKRASLFGIPLRNSIYTLAPARERIARYLTADRIDRVAAAAAENRTLLVGVVDAREGKFYAFDLTALAASEMEEPVKRACYVEALMASAAVPVIFAPVYLDGHQYYDGGVRASVFLDSTMSALDKLGAQHDVKADIYLVFNGYFEISEKPNLKNSLLATLMRTKSIAFDQIDRYSVESVLELGDRHNVRWTHIPSRLCLDARQSAPDQDVFNAPFMACLIEKGAESGSGPDPWMTRAAMARR